MTFRLMLAAGLALALAGCSTTNTGGSSAISAAPSAVETRWVGQSAGAFFAKFGPPVNDEASGSSTVYTWRGGFKNRSVPATYDKGEDGKRGKLVKPARTEYLRCEVRVTVSEDYTIRSIKPVFDKRLDNGKTWCEEFLAGN
ncbi:hypothetical protein ACQ3G6_05220 [Allorhizobium undicola]|uniref:hypothetical protein n=1 Tax=Allorhizobium undicola TaxID=78527 RepID=UPI000487F960|nr:hypothetical protein [Allorhizobium undicola]